MKITFLNLKQAHDRIETLRALLGKPQSTPPGRVRDCQTLIDELEAELAARSKPTITTMAGRGTVSSRVTAAKSKPGTLGRAEMVAIIARIEPAAIPAITSALTDVQIFGQLERILYQNYLRVPTMRSDEDLAEAGIWRKHASANDLRGQARTVWAWQKAFIEQTLNPV